MFVPDNVIIPAAAFVIPYEPLIFPPNANVSADTVIVGDAVNVIAPVL